MRRLALVLVAGQFLVGCASVRLDGIALEQTDCAPTTTVQKSWAPPSALASAIPTAAALQATSHPAYFAAVPFSAPPAPIEVMRTHQRATLSTPEQSDAQKLYEALLRLVPYDGDKLVARTAVAVESATAARDLYLLIQEVSPPAIKADKKLRLALSTPSSGGAPTPSVRETLGEVATKNDVNQRLLQVLQAGGDDALLMQSAAELALAVITMRGDAWNALSASDQAARANDLGEKAAQFDSLKFVRTYFKAYFRGGRLFQSELKIDELAAEALKAVKTQVKLNPSQESTLDTLLKDKLGKICKSNGDSGCLLSTLGKDKLVTRSGETIQFKGISLTLGYDKSFQATWDYPKSVEFAPQAVRVLNEALFDAMEGRVPGVASSTACTTTPPLFGPLECLTGDVMKNNPKLQDVITSVDEKASRADSVATLATGQIIRGVSVVALNNEALAKSAENLAGVLAKKVVERAAWKQSGEGQCLTPSPAVVIDVVKR